MREETGLSTDGLVDARRERVFPISLGFSRRYAPGVENNLEHLWYLERPTIEPVRLAPSEHVAFEWLPIDAAIARVASWTNREALENLEHWAAALVGVTTSAEGGAARATSAESGARCA